MWNIIVVGLRSRVITIVRTLCIRLLLPLLLRFSIDTMRRRRPIGARVVHHTYCSRCGQLGWQFVIGIDRIPGLTGQDLARAHLDVGRGVRVG